MNINNVLKNALTSILSALILVYSVLPCSADRSDKSIAHTHKHHTSYHAPEHHEKFFPMTQRDFFISRDMVDTLKIEDKAHPTIFDFDELTGMLILEAIQIIDIGDPYKIKFNTRRDFNNLYEKYVDFSQMLTSLHIIGASTAAKLPYLDMSERKIEIPMRKSDHMLKYVDPFHIFSVNYWLKKPVEITLKFDTHLTAEEKINWNLTSKFATSLANDRLVDLCALHQMHTLWGVLPSIFPEA